jgi:excisionase family DNA binding protein
MATTGIQLEASVRKMTPVAARPEERASLQALSVCLGRANRASRRRYALVGPDGELPLPDAIFYVLERVAEVLARGDSVTVVPVGKELTTQQAADLLNVSRQYFVRLLVEGKIPFTKTGKHRRVRIEDVLSFKAKREAERRRKLDELARESQETEDGYAELKG